MIADTLVLATGYLLGVGLAANSAAAQFTLSSGNTLTLQMNSAGILTLT